ncbi:MAG: ABC transporter substrate-binding protein [Chloroflexota bacterium]
MYFRKFIILAILALMLVSIVPLNAQETECEDGFRFFDNELLAHDPLCIPENPERIVSLNPQSFDLLTAAGVEPTGAVGYLESIYARNFSYMVEDTEITYVGFPTNIELVLELEPDLIVGSAFADLENYDQLSAIAPTVIPEALPNVQWETSMNFWGEALNLTDEVDALLAEYDARVETLQELVGDPSEIEVSVVRYFNSDEQVGLQIQLANAFSTDILADVGFARPEIQALSAEEAEAQFGSGVAASISIEELPLIDGQYLFAWAQGASAELDADNADAWQQLSDSPLWSTLEAIQNDQAFQVGGQWVGWGFAAAHEVLDDLFVHVAGIDPTEVSPNPFTTDEMDEASTDMCETSFRLVEHTAGSTCVPEMPERVATNVETAVTALLLLGIQPVAGPEDQAGWNAPYVSLLPENVDINAIADIGVTETTNLESLLLTEPDMILTYPYAGEEIYDDLSAVAPTVLIERGANGDWRERFDREAAALNREAEAAEVIARYEAALENLSDFTDLTIAFVRRPNNGTFRMDVVGSFPGSVMEDAGLNLLTAPDGVGDTQFTGLVDSISEERLDILEGADLIITPDWREAGFSEEPDLAGLERLVGWDLLPAVQAGNVLIVPGPVYNGGNYAAAQLLLEAILDAVVQMDTSE